MAQLLDQKKKQKQKPSTIYVNIIILITSGKKLKEKTQQNQFVGHHLNFIKNKH